MQTRSSFSTVDSKLGRFKGQGSAVDSCTVDMHFARVRQLLSIDLKHDVTIRIIAGTLAEFTTDRKVVNVKI